MSEYDERRATARGHDSRTPHEPSERQEPTGLPGLHEDDHEQHAGNRTVNHRPHEQGPNEAVPERDDRAGGDHPAAGQADTAAGPADADAEEGDGGTGRDRLMAALGGIADDLGAAGSGAGGGGRGTGATGTGPEEPEGAPEGLEADELALRRLLHQAVSEIEPRDGTLQHLRRAVPARRARKRQAVVGMAAAALFFGTAVPAALHVSQTAGSDADPYMAGQASQAHGDAQKGTGTEGGSGGSAGSSASSPGRTAGGHKDAEDPSKDTGAGATAGADPSASEESAPACTAGQLGGGTATVGSPDSIGAVYGSFRLSNVSTTSCTASGGGSVSTVAQGAADSSRISVVSHAAGDAATALPDPAQQVSSMVLVPGAAYEVKFAWVPSSTCPTNSGGGTGGTSPEPDPSDSATAGSGSNTDSGGTSPQLMTDDGVADGSVAVTLTPDSGAGGLTTTIPNACAGTVYQTGMLPAS
ncbi:hypothetical protein [Streptomyces nodosus]|uniref:hypothetical protein n=1 Tax=Streptomyces nodosus TaxID=40318 RepID=UPI003823A876